MPRIRYLKPDFFSDEDLAEHPFQTRIAFEGLWCFADKAGRMEDRPKYLKAMIFPYDKVDMEKELEILSLPKKSGEPFIQRYSVNGRAFIQILTWNEHQKPHHTEKDSEIPPAPPLMEKGMEKGMGKIKQLNPSTELSNGEITVKHNNSKKSFGGFKNVFLTDSEYEKLKGSIGKDKADEEIENLSRGIESKGYKYKSHYATILNWERRHHGTYQGNSGGTYRESKGKSTKYAGLETVARIGEPPKTEEKI